MSTYYDDLDDLPDRPDADEYVPGYDRTPELLEEVRRTDHEALIALRVSLARIAQALDLDVPGSNTEYATLRNAAVTYNNGWNTLAGAIIDEINRLNRDLRYAEDQLDKLYSTTNPP